MRKIFFCFLLLGIHQISLFASLSDEDRARALIARQFLVHFVDFLMEANNDIDEEEIDQDLEILPGFVGETDNTGNENISEATICDVNMIVVGQIGYNFSNNQEQNNNLQTRNENSDTQGYSEIIFLEHNNIIEEERSTSQIILNENNNIQTTTFNESQSANQTTLNQNVLPENNRECFECRCSIQ